MKISKKISFRPVDKPLSHVEICKLPCAQFEHDYADFLVISISQPLPLDMSFTPFLSAIISNYFSFIPACEFERARF